MQIELTRGQVATVDDVDADWVLQHNWQAQRAGRTWYAKAKIGGRVVKLHRAIAERAGLTIHGMQVDHVNGDGLDNRRANLRVATATENMRHQTRKAAGKSSHYKGVSWDRRAGKWYACINVDGQHVKLGRFDSEIVAAAAYDAAACHYFGVWAATGVAVAPAAPSPAPAAPAGPSTPRKCGRASSRYLRTSLHPSGKWSAQVKDAAGRLHHVPGHSSDETEMALFADILARDLRPGAALRFNFPGVVATLPPLALITGEQIVAAIATAHGG